MNLPDNAELLKLEEAGLTHQEIAERYGVTRQAVTWRFNDMGEFKRGKLQDVTEAMPWALSDHPAKKALWKQAAFLGLRAFLRERLGMDVSDRSRQALKAFLNRVENGEVLTVEDRGACYVARDRDLDGDLAIRWPADVPKDERVELFELVRRSDGQ